MAQNVVENTFLQDEFSNEAEDEGSPPDSSFVDRTARGARIVTSKSSKLPRTSTKTASQQQDVESAPSILNAEVVDHNYNFLQVVDQKTTIWGTKRPPPRQEIGVLHDAESGSREGVPTSTGDSNITAAAFLSLLVRSTSTGAQKNDLNTSSNGDISITTRA
ncbi:unnamed protein product, partial [Amoebophrya sp. A120]